jgi:hypothetical protein
MILGTNCEKAGHPAVCFAATAASGRDTQPVLELYVFVGVLHRSDCWSIRDALGPFARWNVAAA